MKAIVIYIIYVILTLIFADRVEMNGWEFTLLLATFLSLFYYGVAVGESDKKEDKKEDI